MDKNAESNLRVGIVGLGDWGRRYLERLSKSPSCRVVAIYDRNLSNQKVALNLLNPDRASVLKKNLEEVFEVPLDLLFVLTSASGQFHIAERALLAGINVMVAKPFTGDIDSARKLIELAERVKKRIFVDNTYLFSAKYEAYKKLLAAKLGSGPKMITTLRCDFGRFPKDADILTHLLYHDLYLLDDLFGEFDVHTVKGSDEKRLSPYHNDYANISLHTSKFQATLTVDMVSPLKRREMSIYDETAFFVWDDLVANWLREIPKKYRHKTSGDVYQASDEINHSPGSGREIEPLMVFINRCLERVSTHYHTEDDAAISLRALEKIKTIRQSL